LVDDEVAARFQIDAAAQGLAHFVVDVEEVKNRALAFVQLQLVHRAGHEFRAKGFEFLKLLSRVNANGLRGFAHQVAQHALQKAQVLVQQRLGR